MFRPWPGLVHPPAVQNFPWQDGQRPFVQRELVRGMLHTLQTRMVRQPSQHPSWGQGCWAWSFFGSFIVSLP